MKASPKTGPGAVKAVRTPRKRVPGAAPYHHGDLRAALLHAARTLLEEEGYDALTLRAAARRAGVSQAAPYHHFKDKSALLVAVAAEGFRDFGAAMRSRMAALRHADPRARLNASGVAYVEFAVANPAVFKLMFSGVRPAASPESELAMASAAAYAVLTDAVQALPAPQDEGAVASLGSWALVHGLATLLIEGVLDVSTYGCRSASQLATALLERGR
jgi:AcrR family transcriptional regulator